MAQSLTNGEVPIADVGYKGADEGKRREVSILATRLRQQIRYEAGFESKGYLYWKTDTYLYGFHSDRR
ncbi:hypothetical protein OH492_14895 [Vibrio chagasii]|nr:hypothetical protein [Vibrio chagasii]